MNIHCVLLTLLLLAAGNSKCLCQGTLIFYNRSTAGDAPVTLPDGTLVSGDAFTAGLFLVGNGALSPVATAPFRTGAAAGFFGPLGVSVSGVPPGSPATFRVRVWETAAGSFENAAGLSAYHGEFQSISGGPDFFVPQLGGVAQFPPDPVLTGMLPLTLIPESSSISLFALGCTLFLIFPKHKKQNQLL